MGDLAAADDFEIMLDDTSLEHNANDIDSSDMDTEYIGRDSAALARAQEEEQQRVTEAAVAAATKMTLLRQLCESLSCNDPSMTEVVTTDHRFPCGHGLALGQALHDNCVVQELRLEIGTLLDQNETTAGTAADAEQQLTPLLDYIRQDGRNTVTSAVATTVGGAEQQLEPKRPLNKITLREAAMNEEDRQPLLSPTLSTSIVSLFLQAATASTSLTQLYLQLERAELPIDALCELLDETKSLHTLGILLNDTTITNPDAIDRVRQAFGRNQTLECLQVYPGSTSGVLDPVLMHLSNASSNNTLLELHIMHNRGCTYCNPLAHLGPFVQSSPRLHSLKLGGVKFDKKSAVSLFGALSNMDHSLKTLSFFHCLFNLPATRKFVEFWRQELPLSTPTAVIDARVSPGKRELCLTDHQLERCPHMLCTVRPGVMLAELLQVPTSDSESILAANGQARMSMGSSLDKLTLDAAYINDFLVAYAANASSIRLERLALHGSLTIPQGGDEGVCNWVSSIKTHLRNIVHLRELSVSVALSKNNQQVHHSAAEATIAKDLVSACRHNGSLRHLEINSSQTLDAAPILTNKQKRLVKAYLQRNEHVPKMLNRPCFDGMKAAAVVANGCEDGINTPTHPSFFPALYRVMDPARRTLPNTIVTGLLALGDYE